MRVVATLFALAVCFSGVYAATVLDAYRLVQYEETDDEGTNAYGSAGAHINLDATTWDDSADVTRRCVLIRMEDVTAERVVSLAGERNAGAVVILLPSAAARESDSEWEARLSEWVKVEAGLVRSEISAPVYFVFEDADASALYATLEATSHTTAGFTTYRAMTATSASKKVDSLPVANLQGWLQGAAPTRLGITATSKSLPTLAVVAHYDAYAAAPALARGADANGSGVVALLELARMFNTLYAGSRTQAAYNLLFVLTGAGRENFAGTKLLLDNDDEEIMQTIEATLCLDTLGAGEDLYLHVSKVPKSGRVADFYASMASVATAMDINLNVVHRKINISSPVVYWEHERFSRKRVPAATLSHLPEPAANRDAPNVFDDHVNAAVLKRNIRFAAESIANHIFGLGSSGIVIFNGSTGLDDSFVDSWTRYLSSEVRAQPMLEADSPFLSSLYAALDSYTTETLWTNHTLAATYYTGFETTLSLQKARPLYFDGLLFVGVLAYLGAIHVFLGGKDALKPVFGLFGGGSKSKRS